MTNIENIALIDWQAVYEDVTPEDIAGAYTPAKAHELAAELVDTAVSYLPSGQPFTVDMDDIVSGIEAAHAA